jgi:hypothetical protein
LEEKEMRKLRCNVITHFYEDGKLTRIESLKSNKEDKNMKRNNVGIRNQRQADGTGVPDPPKMVWNKDGSPDYSHLYDNDDEKDKGQHRRNADGSGCPEPPAMRWNRDGTPDYSHLLED